jgi:hypothetical protein
MSFKMHYANPARCWSIVLAALCAVLLVGFFAARERVHEVQSKGNPTWFSGLFVSMLIAWVSAVFIGDMNFYLHAVKFYDANNLNHYPDLDVSVTRGQQAMDGGSVTFAPGTRLDVSKSMAFRDDKTYCVAPVSNAKANATLLTYDFWAVGTNCCSGIDQDFHCGEYTNPDARGGLRLMDDRERPFFRLAVQQAEAAYGIRASHPLFFTWTHDPVGKVNSERETGFQNFLMAIVGFFLFQLSLVGGAVLVYAKQVL